MDTFLPFLTFSSPPLPFLPPPQGSRDSLSPAVSSSHIISGPVSASGCSTVLRRARAQHNALANAFEGAWKQGNLTVEVCVCVCVCVCVWPVLE